MSKILDAKSYNVQSLLTDPSQGLFDKCVLSFRRPQDGQRLRWDPNTTGCKGTCRGSMVTVGATDQVDTNLLFVLHFDPNAAAYQLVPQSQPDVVAWIVGGGKERSIAGASMQNTASWPYNQSLWSIKTQKWNEDKRPGGIAMQLTIKMDKSQWQVYINDSGAAQCSRENATWFIADFVTFGAAVWSSLIKSQNWLQTRCCVPAHAKKIGADFVKACAVANPDCTLAIKGSCATFKQLEGEECINACSGSAKMATACNQIWSALCAKPENQKKPECVCANETLYKKYIKESSIPGPAECVFPKCTNSVWGNIKRIANPCPDNVVNVQKCIANTTVGKDVNASQLQTACNMQQSNTTNIHKDGKKKGKSKNSEKQPSTPPSPPPVQTPAGDSGWLSWFAPPTPDTPSLFGIAWYWLAGLGVIVLFVLYFMMK